MQLAKHKVANSVLLLQEITGVCIYTLFLADKALIISEENRMHKYH